MEIVSEATFFQDLINSATIVQEIDTDLPSGLNNYTPRRNGSAHAQSFVGMTAQGSSLTMSMTVSGKHAVKNVEADSFDELLKDADFDALMSSPRFYFTNQGVAQAEEVAPRDSQRAEGLASRKRKQEMQPICCDQGCVDTSVLPAVSDVVSRDASKMSASLTNQTDDSDSTRRCTLHKDRVFSWRCIDPGHPPDCQICAGPPSPEEERKYVLLGDPERKNGEKKLRSLLQRTPEWRSSHDREALADYLETIIASQADDGSTFYYPKNQLKALVVALRNRDLTALRKSHLLLMCREWKLKSDIWQPRERRSTALSFQVQQQPIKDSVDPRAVKRQKYEENQVAATHGKSSQRETQVVKREATAVFSGAFFPGPTAGNGDLQKIKKSEYQILINTKRELFDSILPQVKQAIENIIRQPFCVACIVGEKQTGAAGEAALQMVTQSEQVKRIMDSCIKTGDTTALVSADLIHDLESLRRVYQLIRLSLLDAISSERVRLLLALDEDELQLDNTEEVNLYSQGTAGFSSKASDRTQLPQGHFTTNTLSLIHATVEMCYYIMSKGLQFIPEDCLRCIRESVVINTSCIMRMEWLLKDAVSKCSNFEVIRQVTLNMLDMLALINSSKDQLFERSKGCKLVPKAGRQPQAKC